MKPLRQAALALAVVAFRVGTLAAQAPACLATAAGSGDELYLRSLQLTGALPVAPVGVSGDGACLRFAPAGSHPRESREDYRDSVRRERTLSSLPLEAATYYNSAFPYGFNDGPLWTGRGLTAAATAGARLRAGPLTVQVAPHLFWAQNADFEMAPLAPRHSPFADPVTPGEIDAPQRFGDDAVLRLDPGESYARLELGPAALGVSTTVQRWGPSPLQPLIAGFNAPGFPHLFAGTSAPVRTPIGTLHGRAVWGWTGQSEYSPVPADSGGRFATGAVISFSPRPLPGLEIGATRFFHIPLRYRSLRAGDWFKVFDPFAKGSLPDIDTSDVERESLDNQLASVYGRLLLPAARTEIYAEYAREDHNWDLRDFLMEPDHQSAYTIGLRTVLRERGAVLWTGTAEVQNALPSHLAEVRGQKHFYPHSGTRQGHTNQGQILGAPFAHGGGATMLVASRYSPRSTFTATLLRARVDQDWRYETTGEIASRDTDVLTALDLSGAVSTGRWEVLWGVHGALELNRHFARDQGNVGLRLGLRMMP